MFTFALTFHWVEPGRWLTEVCSSPSPEPRGAPCCPHQSHLYLILQCFLPVIFPVISLLRTHSAFVCASQRLAAAVTCITQGRRRAGAAVQWVHVRSKVIRMSHFHLLFVQRASERASERCVASFMCCQVCRKKHPSISPSLPLHVSQTKIILR